MFDNRWNDIAETSNNILNGLTEYNSAIIKGAYLEHNQILSENLYYNLVSAHVISMLIEDSTLYIANDAYNVLKLDKATELFDIKWIVDTKYRRINTEASALSLNTIVDRTFNEQLKLLYKKSVRKICFPPVN
ncbi:MAG: hypothetical protein IJA67_00250 [Oscillospiraceae bacterium]|nr:hypothetical protein [Oscillospiraceae bacterium]